MRKILWIAILLIVGQCYAQKETLVKKGNLQERQKLINEFDQKWNNYLSQNKSKFKLNAATEKEIKEHLSTEIDEKIDIKLALENAKVSQLREQFLFENQDLVNDINILAKPAPGVTRFACDNGGFEDGITTDYDFVKRNLIMDPDGMHALETTILCDLNFNTFDNILSPSPVGGTQLVSSGNDPLLSYLNFNSPMTKDGTKALRINSSTSPFGSGILAARMIKTFFIEPTTSSIKFDFNFICENPSHPLIHQPRFIARLIDKNGNIVSDFCLVSDQENTLMFFNLTQPNTPIKLLYTNWNCISLSTQGIQNMPNLADREVTLEISVNGCTEGAHRAYAYIDNICQNVCSASPVYGDLQLDVNNSNVGNCPTFPIMLNGTYTAPHNNATPIQYATYTSMSLTILKNNIQVGSIHLPTSVGILPGVQNAFNFTLNESDFGTPPLTGDFEFKLIANFNANGTNFQREISSIIPGPDVSFNNCTICCSSCCENYLNVIQNLLPSQSFNQQAAIRIQASNTIGLYGTAVYHAGTQVVLKNGFYAPKTSRFRANIEPCGNNNYILRQTDNVLTQPSNNLVIANLEEDNLFSVYPNPNDGNFKIQLKSLKEGAIEITSLDGMIVYKTTFKNQEEVDVNMTKQPKGIYIVKLITTEQILTKKIIKN